MAWQQKIRNMGVKWNELKGELNAMLDVAPPSLPWQMKQLIVNS